MAIVKIAAPPATARLLISDENQASSAKISIYHRKEKPLGGKDRNFFALTDTARITSMGAIKNIAMNAR
jgi:hypothetical protein